MSLLDVVAALKERPWQSAEQIADHFSVEKRTAQKWLTKIEVTKKRKKRTLNPPRGVRGKKSRAAYTPADKLRAVRLRLEEGFSSKDVCAEMGMAASCLNRWVKLYQQFGEAGLQSARQSPPNSCSRCLSRLLPDFV